MDINYGKYIGLSVRNLRLVGQALIRVDIYYQTSSSSVYNADGVNVSLSCGMGYKYIGKLIVPSGANSERYWGTFDISITNPESWFYVTAYCEDAANPGAYPQFTTTSNSAVGYKGAFNFNKIVSAGPYSCTVNVSVRNMYSEEMTFKGYDERYRTHNLNPTSSDGTSQSFNFTMNDIPANTNFSEYAGLVIPGGNGNSPWGWLGNGQGTVQYVTTFTEMSMPHVSIRRNETNVTVSWSAGGTTNKPKGAANRTGTIVLKNSSKGQISAVDVNLEVAGSYTFYGISKDTAIYSQAYYTVRGLVDSSGSSKTYYQYSNEVFIDGVKSTGHLKVNGSYKKMVDTYIKVNGSYKRAVEGYVKVGGSYKKII